MTRRLMCASACALILLSGCNEQAAVDPEALAVRQRLLLEQLPGESVTISEARLIVLEKKDPQSARDLIITGNIDANGHDPWEQGQAVFAVMDASDEYVKISKTHNHDDGDCPFCKHKSDPNQFMALVQIVNEQGDVLQRNAKGLLGLETKQTVVIQGRASINDQDMLVVVPLGIFVVK